MATNIIPFESAKLPTYLKGVDVAQFNDDLTSHVGAGFPVISIKGKTFAIVRGGEREILPNPKDPDSPATSIDVVIVKANKNTSKLYYEKKFEEGVDAKPDCYSTDGVSPAADANKPQSKSCVSCPHNQWGARITEQGKKTKACQDNVRIAVTTPTQLNEPYLLRVPPASFKAMAEYGGMLAKRGVKYNMLVTKIGFEPEAATPQLTFKPVGFLDEASYKQVQDTAASDAVTQILGSGPGVPDAATVAAAAIDKVATSSKPKAVAQVETAAATATAVPETASTDIDFDNLNFDD